MDIDQKIDQLAIEVLRFARSEILVNLRFFNRALARIEFLPAATTIATNGKQLFYDPIYVLREYQIDQKRISRTYLHVVLHCVFQHMFVSSTIDQDLWNVACDIAVEATISELNLSCLNTSDIREQETEFNLLRQKIGKLTAERIYDFLQANAMDAGRLDYLQRLFAADDHEVWYCSLEQSDKQSLDTSDGVNNQTTGGKQQKKRDVADLEDEDCNPNEKTNNKNEDEVKEKTSENDIVEGSKREDQEETYKDMRESSLGDGNDKSTENNAPRKEKNEDFDSQKHKKNEQDEYSSSKDMRESSLEDGNDKSTENNGPQNEKKGGNNPQENTKDNQDEFSSISEDDLSDEIVERSRTIGLSGPDPSMKDEWETISLQIQQDLKTFSKSWGDEAANLVQNLREVNREKYDYTKFLKRFMVLGEAMKINDDEFDYIYYTYGLKRYGNVPLIEPLEYKEVKRIKEFVFAIDTSGSVQGEMVQAFLQKTYNILMQSETFFTKFVIHIIQCDAEIQEDIRITSQKELDMFFASMQIQGSGGTDFRPVFKFVDELIRKKEFTNLKGVVYFTDGFGTYPERKPPYQVAFAFVNDDFESIPKVPPWAIKIVLSQKELRK